MKKNTIIGTILMMLVFVAMVWWNQPSPEQIEAQRRYRDSINQVQREQALLGLAETMTEDTLSNGTTDSLSLAVADSIRSVRVQQKYGNLSAVAKGEEQVVTLSNGLLQVEINTKGGMVSKASLLEYQNYQDTTLVLFDDQNNEMYFTFYSIAGKYLTTTDLYFQAVGQTDTTVTMRLQSEDGGIIDFIYTLSPESYVLNFDIRTQNLDYIVSPTQASLSLTWNQKLLRTELGRSFEERYSSLYYKYADDDPDDLSESSDDDERIDGHLAWVAFKNQFFSAALITNNLFNAGQLTSSVIEENQDPFHLKNYHAELEFDVELRGTQYIPMSFYLGPNSYPLLADEEELVAAHLGIEEDDLSLQKLVAIGWGIFGWVNRFLVIPVFHFLSGFIDNYGIIILLLTIFIKLITLPFTYKSFVSSAKMRVVSKMPEMIAINEKYKNPEDAMQKQQAMMAFYQRVGVSPAGGCLPMLLSWPVLLALFYFFPSSIELRGQSFLWADDLSTYDAIISWDANIPIISWLLGNHLSLFCILMTVTNIIYTKISMAQNPTQQTMPGMKLMMYGMPLMFFAILNNYAAGLSYYYFLSTLLGILQTYLIRLTMDDDKLLAKLQENLKKPAKARKANGWIARLQEIQKQQQEDLKRQREKQMRRR